MTTLVPVADGALSLESRDEDAPLLDAWLPRPHPEPGPPAVVVRLAVLDAADRGWLSALISRPSTFSSGSVGAWLDRNVWRVGMSGRVAKGFVDLAAADAVIDPRGSIDDACSMLTMAAGFLLAGRRRVLLQAAAVRRPDGGVLLLAGDTGTGKSTTAVTLARAPGWAWLSDDQVILAPGTDNGVEVLAWARHPRVDAGYGRRENTGESRDANPELVRSLPWAARGALAGSLLPLVNLESPSATRPAPGTGAMEVLIRQCTWIMAEPGSAKAALEVLSLAASFPARFLDLGLDTYGRPERLAALLDERASVR